MSDTISVEEWAAAWRAHTGLVKCNWCGKDVEEDRRPPAYAHLICYTCLPPPEPLEVVEVVATRHSNNEETAL